MPIGRIGRTSLFISPLTDVTFYDIRQSARNRQNPPGFVLDTAPVYVLVAEKFYEESKRPIWQIYSEYPASTQYPDSPLALGPKYLELPSDPFDYLAMLSFVTLSFVLGDGSLMTDSLVAAYMGWIGRIPELPLHQDAPVSQGQLDALYETLTVEQAIERLAGTYARLVSAGLLGADSTREEVEITPETKRLPCPDCVSGNARGMFGAFCRTCDGLGTIPQKGAIL